MSWQRSTRDLEPTQSTAVSYTWFFIENFGNRRIGEESIIGLFRRDFMARNFNQQLPDDVL